MISNKGYAFTIIKQFVAFVSTQFQKKIKVIRTDNAYELESSHEGVQFYASSGIIHHKSTPNTPQQNGIVERKHRHLLEVGRALYFQSGLGSAYWTECIKTATYLINRTPSQGLNNRSPFDLLYNKSADLSNLKVFGCLCFITSSAVGRDKFMPRAHPCAFIGYPIGQKAYRVLNLVKKFVQIARDIKFFEDIFPLLSGSYSYVPDPHSHIPINS